MERQVPHGVQVCGVGALRDMTRVKTDAYGVAPPRGHSAGARVTKLSRT